MKKPEIPPSLNDNTFNLEVFGKIVGNSELLNRLTSWERSYPYWDKFKYLVKNESVPAEGLWSYIKFQRTIKSINISPSKTSGFQFFYNQTAEAQQFLHKFDMNLGGNLEGTSIIPHEHKEKYLINSIMEEAIASSQLEGAVTTREVAKEMLRMQRRPKDHSEKMILNNYYTIKEIIKFKNEKLSPELILKIHELITKNTLQDQKHEGKFRATNDVKVTDINGTVFYDPPHFEKLEPLIIDFCEFANSKDESLFIHPIIRAIILHFLMGYIHPFIDGNGRTARAIFYWYMLHRGYWLTEYMTISRIIIKSPAQYARAYLHTEYDNNDLTYFINYHLRSMDLAFKNLKEYISRKQQQKIQSFQILKKHNVNQRQALLLKELLNDPELILSIKEIQGKFQVTYQTARNDLIELVEKGYLEKAQQGKAFYFFRSNTFEKTFNT